MSNGRPTASAQSLARATRERFVAEVDAVVLDLAATAQGRLSALAEQPGNVREQQQHRDTFLAFQRLRDSWVLDVRKAWSKALVIPSISASRKADPSSNMLSLIGDEEIENKILVSRLTLAIADKVSWELNDLRVRVVHLDGGVDWQDREVLKPDTFAAVLVDQWTQAGMSRASWQAVQDSLTPVVTDRMLAAYQHANEFLVRNGVMPVIDRKQGLKRSAEGGPPTAGGPGSLPSRLGAAGGAGPSSHQDTSGWDRGGAPGRSGAFSAGGGRAAGPGQGGTGGGSSWGGAAADGRSGPMSTGSWSRTGAPSQTGASASRSGAGGSRGGGSRADTGGHDTSGSHGRDSMLRGHPHTRSATAEETRMMTSTTPLARARQRAQGILGQLKRLLVDRGADFEETVRGAPSPALVEAMNQEDATVLQEFYGPAGGAVAEGAAAGAGAMVYDGASVQRLSTELRQRSTELKRKASSTSEKATIEIVALMFQAILAEERIPAAIRVWFARLQMPVLRVALAEPEFFGTLQHPARQLIDRMGSCVMGFDASGVQGGPMEAEIRRVVQVIEQYPETGRRVFQLVFEEFEKFLSKFLTQAEGTKRLVSVAQQVEQKETLAIQYTIEMRSMLNKMRVRDEIREFLFKIWAEVLAVAALRNGAQDPETLALKRTASELLWAASAKPNREDRARVIQELPLILQRLRKGMSLLGLAQDAQDAQIKIISDILADAFQSRTAPIAQEELDDMSRRLEQLEVAISDDDVKDIELNPETLELMLGVDTSSFEVLANRGSAPSQAMVAWAKELDLGHWFMLDHNAAMVQVQLVWRSDRGQLYLFASPSGTSYLIQAGRLAAYLQAGLLVPAEDETLTVRATRQALAKLDANPERLLG
ncbi:MAG: DUF1631 domain-containing protein [Burkholderiaceae bacterium]|nr:DUF1631 domain-containing protein [Burkholderiaceae bacterium]